MRKFATKFALATFGCVIGLAAVELILGGWFKSMDLNRLHLIKGKSFRMEISHLYEDPNPVITYTRDSHGFRGSHIHPQEIDILTVGGSSTDQRFIRDGETWQDVLQDLLKQSGNPQIVANAGIDGQSTVGHIKNFQWWFPEIAGLRPTYILFYVGINDFHIKPEYSFSGLIKKGKILRDFVEERSALWHLFSTIRGTYLAYVKRIRHVSSVNFDELTWTTKTLQNNYEFMETRLRAYSDRLQQLVQLTREFGAEPIFVSQPTRRHRINEGMTVTGVEQVLDYDGRKINGMDYYLMMRKLDRMTEQVAHQQGVSYFDLGEINTWEDGDFYDHVHMTPPGARKVGTLMFQYLRPLIENDMTQ